MTSYTNGIWTFNNCHCPCCCRVRASQGFPVVVACGELCTSCKPEPVHPPSAEWLTFLENNPNPTIEQIVSFYSIIRII